MSGNDFNTQPPPQLSPSTRNDLTMLLDGINSNADGDTVTLLEFIEALAKEQRPDYERLLTRWLDVSEASGLIDVELTKEQVLLLCEHMADEADSDRRPAVVQECGLDPDAVKEQDDEPLQVTPQIPDSGSSDDDRYNAEAHRLRRQLRDAHRRIASLESAQDTAAQAHEAALAESQAQLKQFQMRIREMAKEMAQLRLIEQQQQQQQSQALSASGGGSGGDEHAQLVQTIAELKSALSAKTVSETAAVAKLHSTEVELDRVQTQLAKHERQLQLVAEEWESIAQVVKEGQEQLLQLGAVQAQNDELRSENERLQSTMLQLQLERDQAIDGALHQSMPSMRRQTSLGEEIVKLGPTSPTRDHSTPSRRKRLSDVMDLLSTGQSSRSEPSITSPTRSSTSIVAAADWQQQCQTLQSLVDTLNKQVADQQQRLAQLEATQQPATQDTQLPAQANVERLYNQVSERIARVLQYGRTIRASSSATPSPTDTPVANSPLSPARTPATVPKQPAHLISPATIRISALRAKQRASPDYYTGSFVGRHDPHAFNSNFDTLRLHADRVRQADRYSRNRKLSLDDFGVWDEY
ncbi:hypothetical protein RI367_005254 [Sorochytrium milnesiophthora]